MTAFEVSLNGQKVCTAGLGDAGVISTVLSWRGTQPYKDGTASATASLEFSVRGLIDATGEHVRWAEPNVRVGDEIRIRLIDVAHADPPQKK